MAVGVGLRTSAPEPLPQPGRPAPLMEPAQVMLTGPRTRAVSQKRCPPAVHSSDGKPLQRAQVQLRQELPLCTNAKTQLSTLTTKHGTHGAVQLWGLHRPGPASVAH